MTPSRIAWGLCWSAARKGGDWAGFVNTLEPGLMLAAKKALLARMAWENLTRVEQIVSETSYRRAA